ncbi:unnamed protein product, partial [Prunus brigantina]
MDAYSGYNQILMHEDDKAKTSFIIERGTYYYKVMPFGRKNAGATYQRLVNKIFKEPIDKTIEVHVDDMLVKAPKTCRTHQKPCQGIQPAPPVLHEVESKQMHVWCIVWPILGI